MVKFRKEEDFLILTYDSLNENRWIYENFDNDEPITLKKTFTFYKTDLYHSDYHEREEEYESLEFILGKLVTNYYEISRNIMSTKHDLYLHKDLNFSTNIFIAHNNISIFRQIDLLTDEKIYVGGGNDKSIPKSAFEKLVELFPNSYEIQKYSQARVGSILRNYFETTIDAEKKYTKYLNKKISYTGENVTDILLESELNKFDILHKKLTLMLNSEDSYNEKNWQLEILQIVLLLYPKYLKVFQNVCIKDTYNNKSRFLDYMLVDSGGNIDIVEIKKPFNNSIVTLNQYRDNHIPLKELSGTVMQIEKYIYYLNKWGKRGEEILTKKYKEYLPKDFYIKITNPIGLIIMGRDNDLTTSQRQDFEIIKRKFRNVADIITYDDLLKRLGFTIEQLKLRS